MSSNEETQVTAPVEDEETCPLSSDAPQTEYEATPASDVPVSETPEDMVAWWNAAIKDYDAMFLVYYRGGYLKEFNAILEELKGKKVGIFAVTAESQANADKAVRDWGLNFQAWSDPQHTLRNYLNDEGLIEIKISGGENSTDSNFYKVHPKIKLYKHGVAQPGVLCVTPDKKSLYSWAINPSVMNIGGASDRPVPRDIWTFVQAKMADPESQPNRIGSRGACSICNIL